MLHPYLPKVTAFITRPSPAGPELLLFRHPNAGIQIPAGTVEEGETFEQAALREAWEESGLRDLRLVAVIGQRDELPPDATHTVFHRTKVYSRPDPTSFDWAEIPRGNAVRLLRRQHGYAQVTYSEGDRFPNPAYLTYVITGWVPEDALAETNRRAFVHLEYQGTGPQEWKHSADSHRFRPFWAPLAALPEIVFPQNTWVAFVRDTLRYDFRA